MATQTEKGKAFEYACLIAIYEFLSHKQDVEIERSAPLDTAKGYYLKLNSSDKEKMNKAANAAVKVLMRYEPKLQDNSEPLFLCIQEDARGQVGDVRDVLCVRRQNSWGIGISCKHNHAAVKHSRLSDSIDFGEKWFGKPCSIQYFNEITPIFAELRKYKKTNEKWRDITDKEERFYVLVLDAFVSELKRLDKLYPTEVPASLITYLLGKNDFYKVIARDSAKETEIMAFNIFGSLNQPSGSIKPERKAAQIRVPKKILDISYKVKSDNTISNNTIIVTCDNGWAVDLRIHSAKTLVEPSLKFDVNLSGIPNSLGKIIEAW